MPDMAVVALLNWQGRRTGKGNSWKEASACGFRNRRGILPVVNAGVRSAAK